MTKQFYVLAGGNGSGKSSFYKSVLMPLGLPFVNADEIAKQISADGSLKDMKKAQAIARDQCMDNLKNGKSFCFDSEAAELELIYPLI